MTARFTIICTVLAFEWAIGAHPLSAQTLSFLRQFSTPEINRAAAVAADATGIYVAGSTGFGGRAGIRKYDPQGNELWTREFNVSTGTAQPIGAASDGTGVYIIGYFRTASGAGPTGQFVRKYSIDGNESWTRQLELSPSLPLGGVAADATGVYVAGSTFIRKYNPAGDEQWTALPAIPGSAKVPWAWLWIPVACMCLGRPSAGPIRTGCSACLSES